MEIAAYYDEIAHCNKCGFCQVACPIFRATGHESGVARGRLALLRAIIEQPRDDATVEQPRPEVPDLDETGTVALGTDDMSDELSEARTMTEVGTKLDLARAYIDMGDPDGARSILGEVIEEGSDDQKTEAQQIMEKIA